MAGIGQFKGFGKANNPIQIFGTRPHITFLPPAKDDGIDFDIIIDINDPHSFWSMKLMTGSSSEMNRVLP